MNDLRKMITTTHHGVLIVKRISSKEIFIMGSEQGTILNDEEAIELRDFLLYCYPKD